VVTSVAGALAKIALTTPEMALVGTTLLGVVAQACIRPARPAACCWVALSPSCLRKLVTLPTSLINTLAVLPGFFFKSVQVDAPWAAGWPQKVTVKRSTRAAVGVTGAAFAVPIPPNVSPAAKTRPVVNARSFTTFSLFLNRITFIEERNADPA